MLRKIEGHVSDQLRKRIVALLQSSDLSIVKIAKRLDVRERAVAEINIELRIRPSRGVSTKK